MLRLGAKTRGTHIIIIIIEGVLYYYFIFYIIIIFLHKYIEIHIINTLIHKHVQLDYTQFTQNAKYNYPTLLLLLFFLFFASVSFLFFCDIYDEHEKVQA